MVHSPAGSKKAGGRGGGRKKERTIWWREWGGTGTYHQDVLQKLQVAASTLLAKAQGSVPHFTAHLWMARSFLERDRHMTASPRQKGEGLPSSPTAAQPQPLPPGGGL